METNEEQKYYSNKSIEKSNRSSIRGRNQSNFKIRKGSEDRENVGVLILICNRY